MTTRTLVLLCALATVAGAGTNADLDAAVEQTLAEWTMPPAAKPLLAQEPWPKALLKRPARVALMLLSVSPGQLTYTTKGTAADSDSSASADYWRFVSEYFGGLEINWAQSDSKINGDSRVDTFDLFGYAGYPSEPIENLRFRPRLGWYYNKYNIKRASPTDVEPWSLGIRFDLEAEYDIVHTTGFLLSLFASGRVGYGWGDASIGGGKESATMLGLGWQAGIRFHVEGLYAALSWIQRVDEYRASGRFSRAKYDFEGAALSFGFRF